MSESEEARKKRLAKQLRANLMRRKAQVRERTVTDDEKETPKTPDSKGA